jgi:hypothetical protein
MHQVEVWHWIYRDPATGKPIDTPVQMTEQEALSYPDAIRIDGSRATRTALDPDEHFQEIAAAAFYQR